MFQIPPELVALTAERRLIPFVGAGFSAALNLPSWESMLRQLCEKVDGSLSYDELSRATGGDYLQIAEYLYLKCDRRIGPIRHQLERSLATHGDTLTSAAHVELVNLGAAQIYTTNYDDLLEVTHQKLGLPVNAVVLPKDVALADTDKTQIVKYHGDLAHENTLVLTESAYYRRLDFESPMDLKFRSDLLGRSVLFMGYSFRDVNIRIIWFKLMQMMRDIPESDRRPSYIVRLEPNAALDELNAAVGLKTIVLHPSGPVPDDATRVQLLGDFLRQLADAASPSGAIPGSGDPMFVSASALAATLARTDELTSRFPKGLPRGLKGITTVDEEPIRRLLQGRVPEPLLPELKRLLSTWAPLVNVRHSDDLKLFVGRVNNSSLGSLVVERLSEVGDEDLRRRKRDLIENFDAWPAVWSAELGDDLKKLILDSMANELDYQEGGESDEDLAWLVDLVQRLLAGQLGGLQGEWFAEARGLVERAQTLYPTIAELPIDPDAAPAVDRLISAMKKREADLARRMPTSPRARASNPRQGRPRPRDDSVNSRNLPPARPAAERGHAPAGRAEPGS